MRIIIEPRTQALWVTHTLISYTAIGVKGWVSTARTSWVSSLSSICQIKHHDNDSFLWLCLLPNRIPDTHQSLQTVFLCNLARSALTYIPTFLGRKQDFAWPIAWEYLRNYAELLLFSPLKTHLSVAFILVKNRSWVSSCTVDHLFEMLKVRREFYQTQHICKWDCCCVCYLLTGWGQFSLDLNALC